MHEGCGTRRSILGALVALAVGAAALGPGVGAGAVKDDGARPRPDYGSKELFKLECELLGGTFSEDGIGNTNCHYPGGWVQCDANGNDCWHTPTAGTWPRSPIGCHHIDGSFDDVATHAPPDAGAHADDGQEPPAISQDQPTTSHKDTHHKGKKGKHHKGKKGKKGKKGQHHKGKGHRHGGEGRG